MCKRGFSGTTRLKVFCFRQLQRQFIDIHRTGCTILHMYDRDWLSPVTLSGEQPVTQLIGRLGTAACMLFQPGNHRINCLLFSHTVKESGIDMHTIFGISLLCHIAAL